MEKLTKHQHSIIIGESLPDDVITEHYDGSLTLEKGIIRYEELHNALNNLLMSDKLRLVTGKNEDFIIVKRKTRIKI